MKLDGEWMCKEIVLGAFPVFVQGIVDDHLEVRRRRGSRLRVRHEGESQ